MIRIISGLLTLFLLIPFLTNAQKHLPSTPEKEIMAAKQVLMRVIGMKAESFIFEKIPSEKGLDVYEVIALGGKVQVKGSSPIAMTRGAYDYLKQACNLQYTWSTDQLTPPSKLPDFVIPRTVSPYKFRQYYNVCAYGYSTAFWKWEDWQKELDWMALHGINMPIAMGGQEAIWQKVFKDMGMTDQELASYFTGPAFLPWQRMGNVNSHDGPLPQSYIDGSRDLQKQVILRMQQLGMEPVVPAFSGFVPGAYKRLYPDSKLLNIKGWCNFPDSNQTYLLPPGSGDFVSIGKRFIEEYQRNYGKVHYYLADLFNENEVPVSTMNRYEELADFAKSVFDAIQAGDPEGTWVMQGWLFYNNKSFWDKKSVQAFLSKIPNDRMIIIDLANEEFHGWEHLDGFFGKPWIYSTIHNYGGNNQLTGNLPLYATDAPDMLRNPKRGNITGFGISPEGINNNEIVYELLTDVAWTSKPIDIKAWMQSYVRQRYGKDDDALFYAFLGLLETIYSSPTVHPLNIYQNRPSLYPSTNLTESVTFDRAVASMITEAEPYKANPRFRNDLVQLVVQYAGIKTDALLLRLIDLYKQGDTISSRAIVENVKELMLMMDALTYALPAQRLETWVESARKWSSIKAESDYYEVNAKRQVTQWGTSQTPVLFEYASKVWSGLIRDYYLGRWMYFAECQSKGIKPDFNAWELSWIETPGQRTRPSITGDVLSYARALYNRAGEYALRHSVQVSLTSQSKGKEEAEVSFSLKHLSPEQFFSPLPASQDKKGKKVQKKESPESKTPENSSAIIYYTLDGSKPGPSSPKAEKSVTVTLPATVKALAYHNNVQFGSVAATYLPVSYGKIVSLNPAPSPKYTAKASASLTDGILGSTNMNDGRWLGYEGENMHATINLGNTVKVSEVTLNCLENGYAWIFAPSTLVVHTSLDGVTFTPQFTADYNGYQWSLTPAIRNLKAAFPETEARFVRVSVYNRGTCPQGSPCEGRKSWLFIDEIEVK